MIDRFTEVVGLERFALYVFDYGAPVGLEHRGETSRADPAIVSQNGNAYLKVSDALKPVQAYWADPSPANRDRAARLPHAANDALQYTHGVDDPSRVSPDGRTLDDAYLARPGADEIQLDLAGLQRRNVAAYADFQAYFRTHQPPLLAVWGRNDPFFLPAGAEAFRRDLPNAEVRFVDPATSRWKPMQPKSAKR